MSYYDYLDKFHLLLEQIHEIKASNNPFFVVEKEKIHKPDLQSLDALSNSEAMSGQKSAKRSSLFSMTKLSSFFTSKVFLP